MNANMHVHLFALLLMAFEALGGSIPGIPTQRNKHRSLLQTPVDVSSYTPVQAKDLSIYPAYSRCAETWEAADCAGACAFNNGCWLAKNGGWIPATGCVRSPFYVMVPKAFDVSGYQAVNIKNIGSYSAYKNCPVTWSAKDCDGATVYNYGCWLAYNGNWLGVSGCVKDAAVIMIPKSASTVQQSAVCREFGFKKYTLVSNMNELRVAISTAGPGSMIELKPGMYYVSPNPVKDAAAFSNPRRGRNCDASRFNTKKPSSPTADSAFVGVPNSCSSSIPDGSVPASKDPRVATRGTIYKKSGTADSYITICGPQNAIIDGSDQTRYAFEAFSIVSSKYIRVAGITVQWAVKSLDIQDSSFIDIYKVRARFSLQEALRVRYNSHHVQIHNCIVEYTGYCYSGEGEGIYIGTSRDNSVSSNPVYPIDRSDYNNIYANTFGAGILSESIDIKEFTSYGTFCGNWMDGSSISGVNGAISQVAIKGNNWNVLGNVGKGGRTGGAVFRTSYQYKGWGNNNKIQVDTCDGSPNVDVCVYLDPDVKKNNGADTNQVGCISVKNSGSLKACNCAVGSSCTSRSTLETITNAPKEKAWSIPEIDEASKEEKSRRSKEVDN